MSVSTHIRVRAWEREKRKQKERERDSVGKKARNSEGETGCMWGRKIQKERARQSERECV